VFSNNVDRHNVSFHSLFYRLALLPPLDACPSAALPRPRATFGASLSGGGSLGLLAGLGGIITASAAPAPTDPSSSSSSSAAAAADSAAPLGLNTGGPPLVFSLSKLPPESCRVSFDDAVTSCVHVRAFSLANVSSEPLTLRLSAGNLTSALETNTAGGPAAPEPKSQQEAEDASANGTNIASPLPPELAGVVGRLSLFQLAASAGVGQSARSLAEGSAWSTGEEAAAKRELLHDRFEVTM